MNSPPEEKKTVTALTITNVILGLLTTAIALGLIYLEFFYQPKVDPQQTQRYVAEAQERLREHADEIRAEAADLAQETLPPIGNAIYAQVQEDYPVYVRTLKTQGDEYLGNVEQIFIAKVKDQYGAYLRAHRDVLKEEFPEHASEENVEKVLKEFEQTLNRIVERYYLDEFRRESERTIALWKQVEPVEVPGPNAPSLQEQLADYTADWAVLAVSETAEQRVSSSPERQ